LRGIIDRVPNFSTSGPKVVEAILNLPIPFDIYVSPAGGRDTGGEAWEVLKEASSREVRQKRVFISHPFLARLVSSVSFVVTDYANWDLSKSKDYESLCSV